MQMGSYNVQSQRPDKVPPTQELSVNFRQLECTCQIPKPPMSCLKMSALWPTITQLAQLGLFDVP